MLQVVLPRINTRDRHAPVEAPILLSIEYAEQAVQRGPCARLEFAIKV